MVVYSTVGIAVIISQLMMATVTSKGKVKALHTDTRNRLEQCWQRDVNWDLYPSYLTKVNQDLT